MLAEQVFLDNTPLSEVAGTPAPGQFALDAGRHVILADNPTGHLVEVTTRAGWMRLNSRNVTVQGFTMRHAADIGLTVANGASGVVVQKNVLTRAHYADVEANAGVSLLNNDIGFGGCLGVHTSPALLQGNRIHDNNVDGFDPGWEAGGIKTSMTSQATWDNNDVYNNDGVGMWTDIHTDAITISNNRIHNNTYHGIMYELSTNGQIFNNTIWSNGSAYPYYGGGPGIFLSTSAHTDVHDNVLAWNGSGIAVLTADRGAEYSSGSNYVHNNAVVVGRDTYGLEFIDTRGDESGDHNVFWYPNAENGVARFGWAGDIARLVDFTSKPADTNGRYLTDDEKADLLAARNIPAAP